MACRIYQRMSEWKAFKKKGKYNNKNNRMSVNLSVCMFVSKDLANRFCSHFHKPSFFLKPEAFVSVYYYIK